MNIGNILRKVGGSIISSVVPGGSAVVELVNGFLPDDKKLPADATGKDAQNAIDSLPPEQRLSLLSKELEVEIEDIKAWATIQDSLAQADAAGASTRPTIAHMMAWLIVVEVSVFMMAWAYAIFTKDTETLKALNDSWTLIVAVVATPTALLRAYFGMRTKEKTSRYQAAAGQPISSGILDMLRGRG